MFEVRGDIWKLADNPPHGMFHPTHVVITTNGIVRKDGAAVMGRGIALEAAKRWPWLPSLLGHRLDEGNNVKLITNNPEPYDILTMPVKYHYREKADLDLIARSCTQLCSLMVGYRDAFIIMPRPGCGNGRLDWESEVKPILERDLDERFTVVTW